MRQSSVKRKKKMAEALLERVPEKELLKAAMTILAKKTSPAKARAARANGKLGGRPRGSKKAA